MDAKKENRLNMYLVLKEYLNNVPAGTIDSMPGFGNYFTDFTANVEKIDFKAEKQAANRTVFQYMKTAGKEETVVYAINMATCIAAYASSVHNQVLEQDMKFTKTSLLRKRDTATAYDAQFILNKGIEFLANLDAFGIKQPEIDKLTAILANFKANIPLPRISKTANAMLTKEIVQLFKDNDNIIEEMDKLVNIKKLTNNDFFTNYYLNRKVVNYHGRKLALRGYIFDTQGNPIFGVQISIPALNVDTKTTQKGYYEFKNLPKGIQNLVYSRVDYATTNRHIGIISGQRVQVDITLENASSNRDAA